MSLQTYTTPSGFLLPSIHSLSPFFTLQPNLQTQTTQTSHWISLILSYARHKRLFILRLEDAEVSGGDWDEIFRNERIERRMQPSHLAMILATLVAQSSAVWEPANQTRAVLLYWRKPEDWAEALHNWASGTGQLNTILTFFEITEPPITSEFSGVPIPILRKAIAALAKTGRAQTIEISDGEGVRFLQGLS